MVAVFLNPGRQNVKADENERYLPLEASIFKSMTSVFFYNIYSPNDSNSQSTFFSEAR